MAIVRREKKRVTSRQNEQLQDKDEYRMPNDRGREGLGGRNPNLPITHSGSVTWANGSRTLVIIRNTSNVIAIVHVSVVSNCCISNVPTNRVVCSSLIAVVHVGNCTQ